MTTSSRIAQVSGAASNASSSAMTEMGKVTELFAEVGRHLYTLPVQWREFVQQAWFIASVTILPTALIAVPFGAVVSMQTGSLIRQLGAESFTGAAAVLVVIQQGSPLVTALLVAGAAGSAVAADLGSRTIREEIDAMEVLGINPVARLVVPRVVAMTVVSVLLNGLVAVVGIVGGYFFNVIVQGGTPGAYVDSFGILVQLPDLWVSMLKAAVFGIIAGVVACHRGLHPSGGPKGVGDAVNQSVVISFLLLFLFNLIITAVYLQAVPTKGN